MNIKQEKQKIKQTLRLFKKEAYNCLYAKNGYCWMDRKRTLKLMNNILKDIPPGLWLNEDEDDRIIIKNGNWRLDLKITDGRRAADLSFVHDDHTAWVIEHSKIKNKWINFDIGGS